MRIYRPVYRAGRTGHVETRRQGEGMVLDADDGSLVKGRSRLSEPVFQTIWDNPLDAEYDRL